MNKLLVPKLRFPEFDGEWEEKKLGDIALKCLLKNKNNSIINVLTNSAKSGIVAQSDYFDRDIANPNNLEGYWVVEIGDFVYNPRISTLAPVGPINCNKLFTGVMSPLYTIFRLNDNNISKKFIQHYFSSTHWHNYMRSIANYGVRDDRMSITSDGFFGMQIFLPSLTEQKEIEKFLTAVDDKIQQLTRKKNLLEQYKKGVMQQIFSQKIRFKDDNGNDYPAWKEKKLGDIGKVSMCKRVMKYDTTEFGDIPFYKIGTFGKIADAYISKELYESYRYKYSFPKNGDILISASGTIGKTVVYDGKQAYFQDSNIVWIDNNEKFIKNEFLLFCYTITKWNTEDTTISRLYNDNLRNINLGIPVIDEQIKISGFLTNIDDKINKVSTQLQQTKTYKNSLLQQMFI